MNNRQDDDFVIVQVDTEDELIETIYDDADLGK